MSGSELLEQPPSFVRRRPRVLAVDYDGTLAEDGRPSPEALRAIATVRTRGVRTVLVTGRILGELQQVFPEVAQYFDGLVVENGAVVVVADRRSQIAPSIDGALLDTLTDAGISARRGDVIVAASGSTEHAVLDAVVELGLECQLVHNRSELMVVPSGVNKGIGLSALLGELGLSLHDCVAVGDAENDHSLLAAAELGVAVANAVESLKTSADLVLGSPDGSGVMELVDDIVGANRIWGTRTRPTITLGVDAENRPVTLPARPMNTIVAGGSGDGKSYLAGLMAEQLASMGYSVLVVDPEGDHVGLGALRPTIVIGASQPPPPVDTVVSLLRHNDACVVVDLSGLDGPSRRAYLNEIPVEVEACRRERGRPHWVFFDEAHESVGHHEAALGTFEPAARGYCLVTWRPQDLPTTMIASTEVVLALTSPVPGDAVVDLVAAVAGLPKEAALGILSRPVGQVVVARRNSTTPPRIARLGARVTAHARHEQKYAAHGADRERSFWFRDDRDQPTGVVASNLHELEHQLTLCPRSVLRHHAPHGDFSRWIADVFHERHLATTIAAIERRIRPGCAGAIVDAARLDLVNALRAHGA